MPRRKWQRRCRCRKAWPANRGSRSGGRSRPSAASGSMAGSWKNGVAWPCARVSALAGAIRAATCGMSCRRRAPSLSWPTRSGATKACRWPTSTRRSAAMSCWKTTSACGANWPAPAWTTRPASAWPGWPRAWKAGWPWAAVATRLVRAAAASATATAAPAWWPRPPGRRCAVRRATARRVSACRRSPGPRLGCAVPPGAPWAGRPAVRR